MLVRVVQRGSIFTLTASAVGAGILALPYVLKNSGIVLGLFVLLLGAVLNYFSLWMLVFCGAKLAANSRAIPSYTAMCSAMYGRKMTAFLDSMLCLYCFGCLLGYIIVISKCIPDVFEALGAGGVPSWAVSIVVSTVLVFPMALKVSFDVFAPLLAQSCLFCAARSVCAAVHQPVRDHVDAVRRALAVHPASHLGCAENASIHLQGSHPDSLARVFAQIPSRFRWAASTARSRSPSASSCSPTRASRT